MAMMVPSGGPLKPPDLQEKHPLGSGVRALWGPGWTRLPFYSREKYCQNGGMVFAHHPASACLGSKMAIMVPSGGP
jgi:hypothetical protein